MRAKKSNTEVLETMLKSATPDPRVADVAYHFIHLTGGPKGFAERLHADFEKAKPGSFVRQRILDMILRSLKVANEQNPSLSDLSLISESDLNREIDQRMKAIQEHAEVKEAVAAVDTGTS